MKKYEVAVSFHENFSSTIYIDAENEKEAEQLAEEMLEEDFDQIVWTYSGCEKEVYATNEVKP